jgi:predicted Ser/Thr protein kinase
MNEHRARRSIAQEQDVSSIPPALPGSLTVTVIKRGPWGKADILHLSHQSGEAILKDYSAKSAPVRWFGRRQLRRERRALARLQGLRGVPADLGEVAPCGLLMEPMHGEPITRWRRRPPEQIVPLVERLGALVDSIHARGVAHLDLRKRDNILVAADGWPSIIDFNASVCFDPGSIGARLVFPLMRRVDQSALLKWKSFLLPGGLSPAESRRHRRMRLLRRFWIFN